MSGKKAKSLSSNRQTLREVAKAANVSEMTVSRVLRRKGSFSDKARDQVLKVVEELGYIPNRLAGSLATSSSDLVAVIVPSLTNQIFNEVLAGITAQLDTAGYRAVVGISEYDLERGENLVRSMLSLRPAGLIVSNTEHSDRARKIMADADIPIVEIMEMTDDPIDICVGIEQADAGAEMARYFLERGYRRIGYVGWRETEYPAAKRFSGFRNRLREADFDIVDAVYFDKAHEIEMGKFGLQELLAKHPDLEAVYFVDDLAAVGGLFHCIEADIDVPGFLALGGFGGLKIGQLTPQKITTVRLKRFETGKLSAKAIIDRLNGKDPQRIHNLGFEFAAGETA